MKTQTLAFATLLLAACAHPVIDRHQYWRDRLATHEAKYAKQPGAIPQVIAFYDNPIVLDTVSLDTQMVMLIERTDSFELLRYKAHIAALEQHRKDSIRAINDSIKGIHDWARIVRLVDTGRFPNSNIMIRELIKLDSIEAEEAYGEFALGASSSSRDADGHFWTAYSDSLGHVWRTTHFSELGGTTILISAPDTLGDWHSTRLHCDVRWVSVPNHRYEFNYHVIPINTWTAVRRYITLAMK